MTLTRPDITNKVPHLQLYFMRAKGGRRFGKPCLDIGYHPAVDYSQAAEEGLSDATVHSGKQLTGPARPENFDKKFDPIARYTL